MLMIPVDGEVAQPFSDGELVKSLTTGTWQTHNGVDILAEQGVPVRAMDNGTVVEVVNDPLWGICVSVDHENGIVSRYCNLSPNVGVQEGDTVESGQTLGTVGAGTILIPMPMCSMDKHSKTNEKYKSTDFPATENRCLFFMDSFATDVNL